MVCVWGVRCGVCVVCVIVLCVCVFGHGGGVSRLFPPLERLFPPFST